MVNRDAIRQAIEIAGTQQRLADACGVKQSAVHAWLTRTQRIPLETALKISAATGGAVTVADIDPSLPVVA